MAELFYFIFVDMYAVENGNSGRLTTRSPPMGVTDVIGLKSDGFHARSRRPGNWMCRMTQAR